MDYDYVAAEQNFSAYGVDEQQSHHRQGGGEDEYEEDNHGEDYYSERGGGGGGIGGGGGELEPLNNIDDSTTAGHDLKHSVDDSSAGKLFVGGIAWETSEESFSRYFSKYGELTDSVIMMDKISGRPRGFGFVTFADPEVANKVLEEEHIIDGRTVEVKRTVPREDMQGRGGVSRTKKIFIGGIPLTLTEDELREYFSAYGKVVEHQIMLDHKTGRSRGFGFVTFETEDAVEKIFTDGQMHELGGKQVEIKKAEPKRSGFDYSSDSRMRRGGSNSNKSYGGGYSGGADGFGGGYGGKMGRGYGGYGGGFGGYGGYGNYAGNYGGGAGFYAGYGGFGYGFGFGGPMYGGAGYGAGSYGAPGGYGAAAGYGGGRGYGTGYDGGKSYAGGGGGGSAAGYGGPKGYGGGGGSSSGGSKGYGNGGATGRFHPYRK